MISPALLNELVAEEVARQLIIAVDIQEALSSFITDGVATDGVLERIQNLDLLAQTLADLERLLKNAAAQSKDSLDPNQLANSLSLSDLKNRLLLKANRGESGSPPSSVSKDQIPSDVSWF